MPVQNFRLWRNALGQPKRICIDRPHSGACDAALFHYCKEINIDIIRLKPCSAALLTKEEGKKYENRI